ncbi:pentatricopeptide repeat-containing protein 2-like protein [Leptotrombidium deliense]|uniref:Pentatricopeptide repeat-containing protein 2-like protein n=1 Tax=Leptotrombidium deliense TaxID=299467 RepID=A0A443SG20_9ACAR|nr:pentatricopeptide repeat-containing protein 2-like protein [Leptotrombidium deliense]
MMRLHPFRLAALKSNFFTRKINDNSYRYLYTSNFLGIDNFIESQKRQNEQFGDMRESNEQKSLSSVIFSDDLKNSTFLTKSEEEFELLQQLIKRYTSQSQGVRFSSFVFGPVVLRLCHTLNKPEAALAFMQNEVTLVTNCNKEYGDFFQQITSYTLTADLLLKRKMYAQILDLYDHFKNKSSLKDIYPRLLTVYVFAACYKLVSYEIYFRVKLSEMNFLQNTPESFKYAVDLLSDIKKNDGTVLRRSVAFMSALALQQNDFVYALEVLSLMTTSHSYVTIRNLRIRALCQVGRLDDALMLLRACIRDDRPTNLGHKELSILDETLSQVKQAVDTRNDKETTSEFLQIDRALREYNFVDNRSFDEVIMELENPERNQTDAIEETGVRRRPINEFRKFNSRQFKRQGIIDNVE